MHECAWCLVLSLSGTAFTAAWGLCLVSTRLPNLCLAQLMCQRDAKPQGHSWMQWSELGAVVNAGQKSHVHMPSNHSALREVAYDLRA